MYTKNKLSSIKFGSLTDILVGQSICQNFWRKINNSKTFGFKLGYGIIIIFLLHVEFKNINTLLPSSQLSVNHPVYATKISAAKFDNYQKF